MKYCAEYGALLDAYVDGELPSETADRVREHLKSCPGCRAYAEELLAIREAFPDAEDTAVLDGFADDVLAAIRRQDAPAAAEAKRPRGWKKILLPLAACFAVAVLVQQVSPGGFSGSGAGAAAPAGTESQAAAAGQQAPAAQDSASSAQNNIRTFSGGIATEKNGSAGGQFKSGAAAGGAAGEAGAAAEEDGGSSPALTDDAESGGSGFSTQSLENAPDYGRSASVTLTAAQKQALSALLDSYHVVESSPESTVYTLTSAQLDEFLSELEQRDISATVTDPENSRSEKTCRLYVTLDN